jgi:hypothetical protein
LLLLLLLLLLFIIYIVHLHVVRPRSCRVIYYYDTPALGIRHQLFDHVSMHPLYQIQVVSGDDDVKIALTKL